MPILTTVSDDWISDQRQVWDAKPGLRLFYEQEIYARLLAEMGDGPALQIGSGAGLFSRPQAGQINSDIHAGAGIDVVTDAHQLAFRDACFESVFGVDVIHHLAAPGRALAEWARVLAPGGRIVLVEPWAGTIGRLFYRYVHHEDCAKIADPWTAAFPEGKAAMDGNGYIPFSLFAERAAELPSQVPGLRLSKLEPFGAFSYLLTGGFQPVGLPAAVIRSATWIEARLPKLVMDRLALRVFVVLEKQAV